MVYHHVSPWHDPEKCKAVFRKDRAKKRTQSADRALGRITRFPHSSISGRGTEKQPKEGYRQTRLRVAAARIVPGFAFDATLSELRGRRECRALFAPAALRAVKKARKLASEVTKHDIATLSNDMVAGKHGGVPSVANARHMRRAASGLFDWAAEAGRDYVTASPCVNLPKLDPEHPRTRVLSEDEIRTFWHGLDRTDLPWDRKTRLALKFELVTMVRSCELLGAHRDELFDLDGNNPRFDVPLKRVKKRRVIQQPLSDLAVEIVREALTGSNKQYVFASPLGDQPMGRTAMANALRGTKSKSGKVKTLGICALLGLKPFTPHDLRRTAATLAGDLCFDDAWIAKCLDHTGSKKQEQAVPTVTGKVYNHSKRMKEKRAVLDGVAAELRRIVGQAPVKAIGQDNPKLAA
jgi:integrase